jgi:hypothetical protein
MCHSLPSVVPPPNWVVCGTMVIALWEVLYWGMGSNCAMCFGLNYVLVLRECIEDASYQH